MTTGPRSAPRVRFPNLRRTGTKLDEQWEAIDQNNNNSNRSESSGTDVTPAPVSTNDGTGKTRYCYCWGFDEGPMIKCGNEKCRNGMWFHQRCANLKDLPDEDEEWYCMYCSPASETSLDTDDMNRKKTAQAKATAKVEAEETADSDDDDDDDDSVKLYCYCQTSSEGPMVACDTAGCPNGEWFHLACTGLDELPGEHEMWICQGCRPHKKRNLFVEQNEEFNDFSEGDAVDDDDYREEEEEEKIPELPPPPKAGLGFYSTLAAPVASWRRKRYQPPAGLTAKVIAEDLRKMTEKTPDRDFDRDGDTPMED